MMTTIFAEFSFAAIVVSPVTEILWLIHFYLCDLLWQKATFYR